MLQIIHKGQHPYKHKSQEITYTGFGNTSVKGALDNLYLDYKPIYTITDPATNAAVSVSVVDNYSGVVITTTGSANAQTIQDPTATAMYRKFVVANNDTSTDNVTVNGNIIEPGKAQMFFWDGSAWLEIPMMNASDVAFTPAAGISSVNVQAAIEEVSTMGNVEDGTVAGQMVFWDGVSEYKHTEVTEVYWDDISKELTIANTLVFGTGSITDSSGDISFGDENLVTTSTIEGGIITDGTATIIGGSISGDAITGTQFNVNDGNTVITEDGSGNMTFTDAVSGTFLLSALAVNMPPNILQVDPDVAEVAGESYQTIAAALVYAATQSPTATNKWGVKVSGTNTENFTMVANVNIIGDNTTRLTGTIIGGALSGPNYSDFIIYKSEITNLNISAGTTAYLQQCNLAGGVDDSVLVLEKSDVTGTITGAGVLVCLNSNIGGGDLSSLSNISAYQSIISSGTLGANATMNGGTIIGGTFAGLKAYNIVLETAPVLGTGTYEFYNSVIRVNLTVDDASDDYLLTNCSGDKTITQTNGALSTKGTTDLVVNSSGGTWTNEGDIYDNSTTGLISRNMQDAIDELVANKANVEDGNAVGQMTYWDVTTGEWKHTETNELVWDDTNKRLGIGTASPSTPLHVVGAETLGYSATEYVTITPNDKGTLTFVNNSADADDITDFMRFERTGNSYNTAYFVNSNSGGGDEAWSGINTKTDGEQMILGAFGSGFDGGATFGNLFPYVAGRSAMVGFTGGLNVSAASDIRFNTNILTGENERMRITSDGFIIVYVDIITDYYLASNTNTFLGVGVAGTGNLAHSAGNDGWYNTVIGNDAFTDATTANSCTIMGQGAGAQITSAISNTILGKGAAGFVMTDGSYNIIVGSEAGFKFNGGYSVIIGYQAGYQLADGDGNVVVGQGTGPSTASQTLNYNVLLGSGVGTGLLTGANDNILIGKNAGNNITTGSENIIIGKGLSVPTVTADNQLMIGPYIYAEGYGSTVAKVGINTTDLDGTPAAGTLTVKGTTNEGSTNVFVLRDSDEANILWVDSNGSLTTTGSQSVKITTVNAATYDLLTDDYLLNVTYTATAAVTNIELKTALTTSGRIVVVKDAGGNATSNNITVTTEGAQTIDGQATAVISGDYDSITLYCDGSNWFII